MTAADFERDSIHKQGKDGRHDIKCKKGLWAVSAATKKEAEREAQHYYFQYYMDGEYDE